MMQLVVVCLLVLLHAYNAAALSVDDNGYVMYCPCMGMFLMTTSLIVDEHLVWYCRCALFFHCVTNFLPSVA